MAVVKMRELLRQPKSVFETLERTGEPIIVTREGEPVAALFPVDREQAAEMAMAALPEFVESRARAANARSEGRTSSAAELLREFESRHGAGGGAPPVVPAAQTAIGERATAGAAEQTAAGIRGETVDPPGATETGLIDDLRTLFGEELSRELAAGVASRIAAASEPVVSAAVGETPAEDVAHDLTRRVHQLNYELFGRLLPDALRQTTLELLTSRPAVYRYRRDPQEASGGLLGRLLAEQTLDAVSTRVESFNREMLDERQLGSALTLSAYEASVRGAQAIEHTEAAPSGFTSGRLRG
jgi:antitoxin (DNA-binding transcriptional repressor) of toxin-antitoxin stability system